MIKTETRDEIHFVKLPISLDKGFSEEFKAQSKSWLLLQVKAYVLDFEQCSLISNFFYQTLVLFKSSLKGSEKELFSINLGKDKSKQINTDGMDQTFSPVDSIDVVKSKLGIVRKPGSKFDVELINPFLKGTVKTLEVQANTKLEPLKIHLKTEPMKDIAIASVISLITDNITGSIALCFPQAVFLKIYENMFGEVHTSISKEIEDAAGELLNIIYGQAKIELNNKPGYNLKKALPTVLVGEKLTISQQGSAATVIIPFKTAFGNFHIEIEIQNN